MVNLEIIEMVNTPLTSMGSYYSDNFENLKSLNLTVINLEDKKNQNL